MTGIQERPGRICHIVMVTGVAIISWLGLPNVASAQVYDAYATADSITVGDRFKIVVSVAHDGTSDVIFPHSFIPDSLRQGSGWSLGDFIFLGDPKRGRRRVSSSWVVDSVLYEATTFALDTAFVSLLPVGLISATDTLVAATPSIFVPVTSLVPEDAENIRDITDLAEFPASSWFWWALLFLVLAGWAYWYFRMRNRNTEEEDPDFVPEPEDPPWDEARERLERLEKTDLSDPALVKPFYVELSEILRTYLERRTNVPALESSTTELIVKLEDAVRDGLVPPDMVDEIKQVLAQADLVKFAKMQPPSDVGLDAISHARTAIDETEKEMVSYESRRAALLAEQKAKAEAESEEAAEEAAEAEAAEEAAEAEAAEARAVADSDGTEMVELTDVGADEPVRDDSVNDDSVRDDSEFKPNI